MAHNRISNIYLEITGLEICLNAFTNIETLCEREVSMFEVDSSFIGDFKTGDNIVFNLRVVSELREVQSGLPSEARKIVIRKPMIVAIASIVEAILHDFHMRISFFNREGVNNLGQSVIDYVKGKSIDKFATYIASAKKHKLFHQDDAFYEDLNLLRMMRNRIHIHVVKRPLLADEVKVFTPERQVIAEKLLEYTMRVMSMKYARGKGFDYVEPFLLPWEPYFSNDQIKPVG